MIGMFFYTAFIAVAFLYQESVKNLKSCYSSHFRASNHNKQGTKTINILSLFSLPFKGDCCGTVYVILTLYKGWEFFEPASD